MAIFALSDLHLDLGAPDKGMEIFGPHWKEHKTKIAKNWERIVSARDVVLIPGDLSWSASLSQAAADLRWLDQLPGTKVAVRGNHDHWWGAIGQTRSAMPRSIHLIQNNHLRLGATIFLGTKLEDSIEVDNLDLIDWQTDDKRPPAKYLLPKDHPQIIAREELYRRELERLKLSIESISPADRGLRKIALLHYPPTTADLKENAATRLLESVPGLTDVVFGHLHSMRRDLPKKPFGVREGANGPVHYRLCSADWLDFSPIEL